MIKIKLKCSGRTEILKNVAAKFKDNKPSLKEILLVSILDKIKQESKILESMKLSLNGMEISYYSYEDETDIFTGVYGGSISPQATINLDEITKDGKVILNIEAKATEACLPKVKKEA